MSWILLILQLVLKLIEWLTSQQKLSPRQRKRLNHLLARCKQLEGQAVSLGCKAGGKEDPDEERLMLKEAGH
jgi:hypothetical protein